MGVSCYPSAAVRAAKGFNIGSNSAGSEQTKGVFEEFETFNYPLDASQIQADYLAMLEPHSFELTIPSRHVNYVQVPATIEGGAAGMMAVLMDGEISPARPGARLFLPSFTLDLGAGDAAREVWLVSRG